VQIGILLYFGVCGVGDPIPKSAEPICVREMIGIKKFLGQNSDAANLTNKT